MSILALLRSKKPSPEFSDGKYSAIRSLVVVDVVDVAAVEDSLSAPILVTEKASANVAMLESDTAMMADVTRSNIERCCRRRRLTRPVIVMVV